jgi:hypothetical protein
MDRLAFCSGGSVFLLRRNWILNIIQTNLRLVLFGAENIVYMYRIYE